MHTRLLLCIVIFMVIFTSCAVQDGMPFYDMPAAFDIVEDPAYSMQSENNSLSFEDDIKEVTIVDEYLCGILIAETITDNHPMTFDNFIDFVTGYMLLEWGITVLEAEGGRLWATRIARDEYGQRYRTGELLKSTDYGESWVMVYAFDQPVNAIYADGFGNIFVTTTLDRWAPVGTGRMYRSSDSGETFQKVLDVLSGVPIRWNIASQDGTMFASEYGFKWEGDNARRIYRSLDFGETWQIVFEPEPIRNFHHHVTIITEDGTVYQSIGDWGNSKIIRSTNNGESWETVYGSYLFQPTSAVVFDTHILWGLDGGPWNGVARYDRITGEFTESLRLTYPFAGSNYDMVNAHGVVYAMFLSYRGGQYDHPASIFFSTDEGYTWELMGYIEKAPEFAIGFYHIIVDDRFGYIDFGGPIYQDGIMVDFYRGTLRFELLESC